jgi:plastocyanin
MKRWLVSVWCLLTLTSVVKAQDIPSYTASPSAVPQSDLCVLLRITEGDGALAPQKVGLETVVRDEKAVKGYKYHFGDGEIVEGGKTIAHEYKTGGTYSAYVEVKDAKGKWQTSGTCAQTVTLKQPPLVSNQVACGEVVITAGNETVAPAQVTLRVNGTGDLNKVTMYKVDFGQGTVKESSERTFSMTYSTPGTYEIKGYVRDNLGLMYGGTEACVKTIKVLAAQPLTVQPDTGVPTSVWVGIGILVAAALLLRKLAYAPRA